LEKYLKSKEDGQPKVFSVSTVTEFVELTISFDEVVIFRGQTTSNDWPLVPLVGRNVRTSEFLRREEEILDEFKRESIPQLDFIPKNDNNWQWLALAQHNRLPTRLLDWTKNPLAALWFAIKDPAIEKQPGVVWVFYYKETPTVHNSNGLDSPFEIDKTYVYFPEHVFPSIQAQSSVFTVHHKEGIDSGRFVPFEEMEDSDLLLKKIEIDSDAFDAFINIRYQLSRIGVGPASLLPGLSGVVDRIRYENMKCKDETLVDGL